ncbi:MAG: hypothetical protein LBI70_02420 [Rickettsiales bacterium]|nr:hypothetical protein [Rickettsiales bacterium]
MLSKKSVARLIACQVLAMYYDQNNEDKDIESLSRMVNDHYVEDALRDTDGKNIYQGIYRGRFTLNLIQGVIIGREKFDDKIKNLLRDGSSINSLDSIVLQSLRLACFELSNFTTARKIIISEYVDIVAEFCDKNCTDFTNGVLDRMMTLELKG